MRVVVDTNVFISAALKEASLPAVALHLVVQHGMLLKSAETEVQLADVLDRPQIVRLIPPATRTWMLQVMAAAEFVEIMDSFAACRDPTDDRFLDLAVNGHADVIVTGDHDLLELHPFRGVPIVQPAVFIRDLRR